MRYLFLIVILVVGVKSFSQTFTSANNNLTVVMDGDTTYSKNAFKQKIILTPTTITVIYANADTSIFYKVQEGLYERNEDYFSFNIIQREDNYYIWTNSLTYKISVGGLFKKE